MKAVVLAPLLALCLLLPTSASARARDASANFRPGGLVLADVNGDRVDDWVGIDTEQRDGVTVRVGGNHTFDITTLPGGSSIVGDAFTLPRYVFTGRFNSKVLDDVCVFHITYAGWSNPRITCFEYDGNGLYNFGSLNGGTGGTMASFMPTQRDPVGVSGYGYAVGDFDGDGYDDVLTYTRYHNGIQGPGVRLWRFDRATGQFVANANVDLGDFRTFPSGGAFEMRAGELGPADANGARRDDVVVTSMDNVGVFVLLNIMSGGRPSFWLIYANGLGLAYGDELAIADADGDRVDDLVSITPSTGAMRFLSLEWWRQLQPLPVVQGNIPSAYHQPLHLMWSSTPGSRDRVTAVFADSSIARYSPALESNGQKTYWWVGSYSLGYVWSRINR